MPLFVVVFAACLAVGFALSYTPLSLSAQRRVYWCCAALAAAAGVASSHPTYHYALLLGVFPVAAMTVIAFAFTPYLRIGGRVRALTLNDSLAESGGEAAQRDSIFDAYTRTLGAVSTWWCLAGVAAIAAGNVCGFLADRNSRRITAAAVAFALVLAAATGVLDGREGHRVARGQWIQFAAATLVTGGVFAVVYGIAYLTAVKTRPRETSRQ